MQTDTSEPALLYLSKLPPSPSGIGLYADEFVAALRAAHVNVEVYAAPPDPLATQRWRQAVVGFRLGRCWGVGPKPLHIELSGRALFEFYAGLGFLTRANHPNLSLTCHDAPSVAGAVLLFRFLDRRGLRRVGLGLSQRVGPWLTRRVVSQADAVFALTAEGARELAVNYRRPITHLPHVVPQREPHQKEPAVFLPGYLGSPAASTALARVILAVAPLNWTVRIGACSDEVRAELGREPRVTFTGFLDESALLSEFDRASLVVRERPTEEGANSLAASCPLSWAVAAHCHCITNDQRAGARELADLGLVHLTNDVSASVRAYFADPPDPSWTPPDTAVARESLSAAAVAACFLRSIGPDAPNGRPSNGLAPRRN